MKTLGEVMATQNISIAFEVATETTGCTYCIIV
jgi:hypothetical protein